MRKVAVLVAMLMVTPLWAESGNVKLTIHQSEHRVDVTIDGQAFTSYQWPTSLMKPVLYPLIADGGLEVSRGYPLKPRDGERTDHPHHAGMWFNYGNVNGFDLWNNSTAIPEANKSKMGIVREERIVSATSGNVGKLVVEATWIGGDEKPLLREQTTLEFAHRGSIREITRTTTLTALQDVVFHDDKEGLLGIRVARWLESPNEKGGIFKDASGHETKIEGSTGAGATGVYLTSEGKEGDAVWSTRGRWCVLNGHDPSGRTAAIAIIDQQGNPGYPTYWHARGYGLFAANPLGAHIFDPQAPQMDFKIAKSDSKTFRYRVLLSSKPLNSTVMNAEADAFAK
jgi:hypothetical protein